MFDNLLIALSNGRGNENAVCAIGLIRLLDNLSLEVF